MRTLATLLFIGSLTIGLGACNDGENTPASQETPAQSTEQTASTAPEIPSNALQSFTAYIISSDRANIGTAEISNTSTGISVIITAQGLTPGLHGMHFHKVGDCSDEGFKLSGGHINPMGKQHGLKNSDGPDNADLPNLSVGKDGTALQTVINDRLSLNGEGGRPALLDGDGSALVIHANPDDQISQPIGGAGARIACAVVMAL